MKLPAALGNLVLLGLVVLTSTPTNDLISDFFGYLPNLLLALGIVATSYLLAGFLLRSVLIGAVNAHMSHASAIARAGSSGSPYIWLCRGIRALSIGRTVVLAAFSNTFGGIVLALALACGLVEKDMARDFLDWTVPRQKDKEPPDEMRHV